MTQPQDGPAAPGKSRVPVQAGSAGHTSSAAAGTSAGPMTTAGLNAARQAAAAAADAAEMPKTEVPFQVSERATWLLANNPGPMTFNGTNSWVLREPGRAGTVVVDPGPDDDEHLSALLALAVEQGGRIDAILLTHGHPDHWAGAGELSRRSGAPVLATDPARGSRALEVGPIEIAGLKIEVIHTPGHSSDSTSFRVAADDVMLTGDTVMGRSAPTILDPDGRVDQTISSLQLLTEIVAASPATIMLPGHGPLVTDPASTLALALAAREVRLKQHEDCVRDGNGTVSAVADELYGPFDERLRRPIEATVRAHLRYLADTGRLSQPIELGP